jgi:signal transduction histidine kinase/ActR/RegA family two-component response regulator
MYRFGIRTLIAALAFAGGLLGLLAGGLALFEFSQSEKHRVREMLLETARAFSAALDGELGTIEEGLTALSHFDSLENAEFVVLSRSTAAAVGGADSWVTLLDPAGRRIISTAPAPGATALEPNEADLLHVVMATRGSAISNVFISPLIARPVVSVGTPVIREGEVKYVLTMTVSTEHFAAALERVRLPPDWIAVIIDRDREVVARMPALPDKSRGASALADTMRSAEEASYDHVDVAGVLVDGAFTRSRLSGWSAGVGVSSRQIDAPFRRSLVELGTAAFIVALAGLLLAWRVGRRVTKSVTSLSRAAEALGCGEVPLKVAVGIREIEQTGAALLDAAELMKRQSADREKVMQLLRQVNHELELKVEERMGELAAADRQLSEEIAQRRCAEETVAQQRKMEAIGQLTAGIAHDFNNLLTAVIGNLELLRPRLGDERGRRLARDAADAAERAALLTKQLLAFGRKQRLETRIVAIDELVAGAAPLIEQAAGPFVAVELCLGEDAGAVAVDAAQMQLALLNLAINARDAMPGGGRLAVETRRLQVVGEHPDVAPGDWVLISVTDTGLGMSTEVAARAFEPFFTTKEAGTGSGLGLSMVYGLVKQLGGEVTLVSVSGQGTSVKIYLPRAADAERHHRSGYAAEPKTPSCAAKVLVVDDNAVVRAFMAGVLSEAGYDVAHAASGPQAAELFGSGEGFDAVVMDYAMPGMNGIAAARIMLARSPDTPILLVTGFVNPLASEEWPSEDILHKPFGAENLRQSFQALMERRRSRPERA